MPQNQSGMSCIFSFLNAVWKKGKSIKLKITPESFGKLFALVNGDIAK